MTSKDKNPVNKLIQDHEMVSVIMQAVMFPLYTVYFIK